MANGRTGSVSIEDFDIGLATTFGSELVQVTLDGELAEVYALRVAGVTGPDLYQGLVPVFMSEPEDAMMDNVIPHIMISRGSIQAAQARWFGGGHEYMVPAHGAVEVTSSGGLKGPSRVEVKPWSRPFDISYDVHIRARLRSQADRMLMHLGRYLWAYGQVFLTDSEGDSRGYYAFADSYENLSEISDVSERLQGYTIPLRVEAELDFDVPFVAATTHRMQVRTGPLRAKARK